MESIALVRMEVSRNSPVIIHILFLKVPFHNVALRQPGWCGKEKANTVSSHNEHVHKEPSLHTPQHTLSSHCWSLCLHVNIFTQAKLKDRSQATQVEYWVSGIAAKLFLNKYLVCRGSEWGCIVLFNSWKFIASAIPDEIIETCVCTCLFHQTGSHGVTRRGRA